MPDSYHAADACPIARVRIQAPETRDRLLAHAAFSEAISITKR